MFRMARSWTGHGLGAAALAAALALPMPAEAIITSVQYPYSLFAAPGQTTEAVVGAVTLAGVTDGVGQGSGIDMVLRWGTPDNAGGFLSFSDITMAYLGDDGAADLYSATITPTIAGLYSYVVIGFDLVGSQNAVSPQGGVLTVEAPEPASLALMGAGVLGLALRRRRAG